MKEALFYWTAEIINGFKKILALIFLNECLDKKVQEIKQLRDLGNNNYQNE